MGRRSKNLSHRKYRRGQKTPMRKRMLALDVPLTSLADDQVLSFPEWCSLNRISERTGRRLLNGPDGPTVTMLSARRVGVTVRANRAWQQSRERLPGGAALSTVAR